MSFLDRFKLQPKWKNPDPAIRAAAVEEIPDDPEARAVLSELALSDEDVRVRRAAAARLDAVDDLVRIARSEHDHDLKREVADRLVAIANAPSGADGGAALALEGLDDQKQFAAVAKASPHDTIRTVALSRITDVKLLGSVARQASDPQIALDAVGRIADPVELTNVAVKTDHKDAGIAALERAADAAATDGDPRDMLEGIASRARNKAVVKRARAILQGIEEAEAARRAAIEHWQQQMAALMARLETLAAAPSLPDVSQQIDDTEAEWRQLSAPAGGVLDSDTASRFASLVTDARAAVERFERQEAERRAEAEREKAVRTVRLSLCERMEALRGDDAVDQVAVGRAEWEGLPEPAEQAVEDAELRARFEEACRRAVERHARRQELDRVHARLAELSVVAEQLAAQNDLVEDHPGWQAVLGEWRTLHPQSDGLDAVVSERMEGAERIVHQRGEEKRAAAERTLKQQAQRVEQLIDRVQKRAPAEDLTLREADRAVRDLRAVLESPPSLPDERERHAMVERVRAAIAVVSPRLHDLREMDEWKRFANAAVQEELIAKTEALRAKYGFEREEGPTPDDVEKAARELHEIQERWKQVAEAPRAQAQALWHRYRQAADPVQAKAREFFAHRAEERAENLKQKLTLIERAEALADSTDWIKTADELKRLQAEWQQLGPVPRPETKTTWKRFRDACDRFFTRRNADLAQRKETWSANLAKKEALCARAEELATSREWERAASEIRRLQAEWKTVGPVRRNKSEAIWQRFRAACDTFFERYKRRDEIEIEAKQADREGLVAELEALIPGSNGEGAPVGPPDLLQTVRGLRSRWNQTTPVVRQGADPLSARFVAALERLIAAYPDAFRGTELDIDASRQKMEKLCARVEAFIADAAPSSSSQALADMLREALASNTIGGRAGEESKWRAMADEVRQAQSAFAKLGPVPGDAGRLLAERFQRASNRFFDQYRRKVPPSPTQPRGGGRAVGAR